MFEKSTFNRPKFEIEVTISLNDGDLFDAVVFIRNDERLIDLLNDNRGFIPVKREDGPTVILAKNSISCIVERIPEGGAGYGSRPTSTAFGLIDDGHEELALEDHFHDHEKTARTESGATGKERKASERPERRTFDPYKTLRVSPNATDAEIRRSYKARIKAVHPDTLSGLEIDDEISKAAILATQKVNTAYNRIMRLRRRERAEAETGKAEDVA